MAYNRLNLLKKVEKVQAIYSEHSLKGVTAERIFSDHIQPVFHISRTTFFNWLNINVTAERRKENERKQQAPTLFDLNTGDEDSNNDQR